MGYSCHAFCRCVLNSVFRSLEDTSHPPKSAHRKGHSEGEGLEARKGLTVSPEEDEKTQLLSQGLTLLLAARERVLTLSEQRVCPFSLPIYHYLFSLLSSSALSSRN